MPTDKIRVVALGGRPGGRRQDERRRGVFTPEEAINPDAFFDELAPLCTPKKKNAKELVEIDIAD